MSSSHHLQSPRATVGGGHMPALGTAGKAQHPSEALPSPLVVGPIAAPPPTAFPTATAAAARPIRSAANSRTVAAGGSFVRAGGPTTAVHHKSGSGGGGTASPAAAANLLSSQIPASPYVFLPTSPRLSGQLQASLAAEHLGVKTSASGAHGSGRRAATARFATTMVLSQQEQLQHTAATAMIEGHLNFSTNDLSVPQTIVNTANPTSGSSGYGPVDSSADAVLVTQWAAKHSAKLKDTLHALLLGGASIGGGSTSSHPSTPRRGGGGNNHGNSSSSSHGGATTTSLSAEKRATKAIQALRILAENMKVYRDVFNALGDDVRYLSNELGDATDTIKASQQQFEAQLRAKDVAHQMATIDLTNEVRMLKRQIEDQTEAAAILAAKDALLDRKAAEIENVRLSNAKREEDIAAARKTQDALFTQFAIRNKGLQEEVETYAKTAQEHKTKSDELNGTCQRYAQRVYRLEQNAIETKRQHEATVNSITNALKSSQTDCQRLTTALQALRTLKRSVDDELTETRRQLQEALDTIEEGRRVNTPRPQFRFAEGTTHHTCNGDDASHRAPWPINILSGTCSATSRENSISGGVGLPFGVGNGGYSNASGASPFTPPTNGAAVGLGGSPWTGRQMTTNGGGGGLTINTGVGVLRDGMAGSPQSPASGRKSLFASLGNNNSKTPTQPSPTTTATANRRPSLSKAALQLSSPSGEPNNTVAPKSPSRHQKAKVVSVDGTRNAGGGSTIDGYSNKAPPSMAPSALLSPTHLTVSVATTPLAVVGAGGGVGRSASPTGYLMMATQSPNRSQTASPVRPINGVGPSHSAAAVGGGDGDGGSLHRIGSDDGFSHDGRSVPVNVTAVGADDALNAPIPATADDAEDSPASPVRPLSIITPTTTMSMMSHQQQQQHEPFTATGTPTPPLSRRPSLGLGNSSSRHPMKQQEQQQQQQLQEAPPHSMLEDYRRSSSFSATPPHHLAVGGTPSPFRPPSASVIARPSFVGQNNNPSPRAVATNVGNNIPNQHLHTQQPAKMVVQQRNNNNPYSTISQVHDLYKQLDSNNAILADLQQEVEAYRRAQRVTELLTRAIRSAPSQGAVGQQMVTIAIGGGGGRGGGGGAQQVLNMPTGVVVSPIIAPPYAHPAMKHSAKPYALQPYEPLPLFMTTNNAVLQARAWPLAEAIRRIKDLFDVYTIQNSRTSRTVELHTAIVVHALDTAAMGSGGGGVISTVSGASGSPSRGTGGGGSPSPRRGGGDGPPTTSGGGGGGNNNNADGDQQKSQVPPTVSEHLYTLIFNTRVWGTNPIIATFRAILQEEVGVWVWQAQNNFIATHLSRLSKVGAASIAVFAAAKEAASHHSPASPTTSPQRATRSKSPTHAGGPSSRHGSPSASPTRTDVLNGSFHNYNNNTNNNNTNATLFVDFSFADLREALENALLADGFADHDIDGVVRQFARSYIPDALLRDKKKTKQTIDEAEVSVRVDASPFMPFLDYKGSGPTPTATNISESPAIQSLRALYLRRQLQFYRRMDAEVIAAVNHEEGFWNTSSGGGGGRNDHSGGGRNNSNALATTTNIAAKRSGGGGGLNLGSTTGRLSLQSTQISGLGSTTPASANTNNILLGMMGSSSSTTFPFNTAAPPPNTITEAIALYCLKRLCSSAVEDPTAAERYIKDVFKACRAQHKAEASRIRDHQRPEYVGPNGGMANQQVFLPGYTSHFFWRQFSCYPALVAALDTVVMEVGSGVGGKRKKRGGGGVTASAGVPKAPETATTGNSGASPSAGPREQPADAPHSTPTTTTGPSYTTSASWLPSDDLKEHIPLILFLRIYRKVPYVPMGFRTDGGGGGGDDSDGDYYY